MDEFFNDDLEAKTKGYRFARKANRALEECRENVFIILTEYPDWRGVLGFNEFSGQVIKVKPPPFPSAAGEWAQEDDFGLGLWLMQELNLVIKSDSFLVSAVAMAAFHNRYHPVKDWLEGLPPWDQENRLEYFISDCTGCKNNAYTQLVGKYFMIGLVARIFKPGCLMQYMPIFEGEQGVGKSTFWQTLAGQWYQDTPFKLGDKDAYMQLQGVWLYEIAELDSFNKAEATHVKAFITQRNDRFREPYGRRVVDWPRQCVFVGTTNHYEYFKDTTGNRRFWPIKVKSVDSGLLGSMREQLFAEALWRYRYGEQWHPTFEEEAKWFVPQQEHRRVVDPWLYPLQDWLNDVSQRMTDEFMTHEILTQCFKMDLAKVDAFNQMSVRVGRLMQELGWEKGRHSTGDRKRFYRRPKK